MGSETDLQGGEGTDLQGGEGAPGADDLEAVGTPAGTGDLSAPPGPGAVHGSSPATAVPPPRSRLRGAAYRTFGGLPRDFWFLWSGTLVNRLGTFVEPFLALYLTRERGLSVSATGLVLGLLGVGGLLSQGIGGSLADRIGRRPTLAFGMFSAAAAMLLLGSARALPMVVLGTFLIGLTLDLYRPASSALIADLVPPAERPRAFALLFWAVNLGFAFATTLAGFVAESGYTLLFVGDAITSAVFGLLVLRGVRESRPPVHRAKRAGGPGYGQVVRDRVLLGVVGLQLASACIYFQVFFTLPLAMRANGLRAAAFGLVIALNGVLIVVLQPLVAGWLSRLPRVPLLAASQLVIGLGFGLNSLATTTPAYAAAVVVWTLGEIAGAALTSSIVADLAPPELRGRYSGMFGMSYAAAAILAPVIGTAVFDLAGPVTLWVGCAALGATVATGTLALGPAIRARAATAH